ncbi:23S rRNA (pseudouridine(1915)-N(3))-methyltransferase RlmH [Lichenihabitans sp. Uapishka_5]|uniref:23S rRNA (pseudouridine(1915)-N(3))-methyltransferase RlmH n=1 Tax=Lichenihabitans sp. Uapishka_5 TaxID=3037302 RepID=UPI0029E80F16|nr:23S rRNA (pseudouridine(1915)-N(3))-methyltransferase RlmH [Lichenihabitans sp. Uapishka_5]MDX7949972.1 23S rRNA (pseudouridine(1915)-N(3))-methyltransferase RlmH [Lichenihabitans sp. Uapishka_5]
MRLLLLAVGRMKAGPERDLLKRYVDRAQAGARGVGLAAVSDIEIEESRARTAPERKAAEAAVLATKIPAGAKVLLLDERGRAATSLELAKAVGTARDGGCPAFCFAVGGPDGFAPDFMAGHDLIAFGGVTFPHQIVRVLVAEQLYRITTILAGHPYHRA